MAWASSGGYPGVVSNGSGGLEMASLDVTQGVFVFAGGFIEVAATPNGHVLRVGLGEANGGLGLAHGVGVFGHDSPAAATVGGAATAGGTYTAVEQAMLNVAYTALRSIGLVT